MSNDNRMPITKLKSIFLASTPLLLAIGITWYRMYPPFKPHTTQGMLAQRRSALVQERTARLIRESQRISASGIKGPAATKELNAAFYSAQKDYFKVVNSGYTIPYPSSSR